MRAAAYGFGDNLWNSEAEKNRRDDLLLYANQYLPKPITSLVDFEQTVGSTNDGNGRNAGVKTRSNRNIVRTLVDTAMSRFAKTETRVQYMTNGGTPGEQDVAEERTDAANALIEQTEGERWLRKAALHGTLFDLGAVQVIDGRKGPENEHCPSWELMYDSADAKNGRPTILVKRRAVDKAALGGKFAGPVEYPETMGVRERAEAELNRRNLRDEIEDSTNGGMVTSDHTPSDQHCVVYELWRLPVGDQKGRHIVCTDKALCLDEEWTDDNFGFVFFGYSENPVGPYPVSIAAIVSDLQIEINGLAERRGQILRQMAVPMWIEHAAAATNGESASTVVQLRGGSGAIGDIVQAPAGVTLERVTAGNIMGTELYTEEDRAWSRGYQMAGISEQATTGSRPAGLNSAPSQREWNELQQDRLSLVAINYQQSHVDLCDRLLEKIADMPEYRINIKHPNGKWLKKVRAADLDLENSDYMIVKMPIGALPTTPSGKLAAAADLLQADAITKEDFKQIVQLPDLKAVLNIDLESRRATEKMVGKILAGKGYDAPFDKMDLAYCVKYGTAKLMAGYTEDIAEDRLRQLNDWIDDAASRIEKKAAKAAAAAPAPAPGGPQPLTSLAPQAPPPLAPLGVAGVAGMAA